MSDKKVAINGLIMDQRKAGIGNYTFQLLQAMMKMSVPFFIDVYIQQHMKSFFADTDCMRFIAVPDFKGSQDRIWYEQWIMPSFYNKNGYEVVHFVDYLMPLGKVNSKKVVTLHDVSFYKKPEYFTLGSRLMKQFFTMLSVRKADRIICVSQNTRKDIQEKFPFIKKERLKVIYLAAANQHKLDLSQGEERRILQECGISGAYLLYVGTLEPRKNVETLIRAFQLLIQDRTIPHNLILCGKKGWKYEGIFKLLQAPDLMDRVRVIGYMPDDKLPVLYRNADAFVYPSFYEGFGLPPLEAMKEGTAVITSDTSSLPEVVGQAALLCNPKDVLQLKDLMDQVLRNHELKESLIQRGYDQIKQYSWEITAQKTLEVYQTLLLGGT